MRVGVDFSVMAGKFQGSRSYLLGLYEAAVEANPQVQFYFYHPEPEQMSAWPVAHRDNVTLRRLAKRGGAFARLGLWLPKAVRDDRLDVIHTQYMLPLTRKARRIVTIHDVLYEEYPQFFPRLFRWRSKILIRATARIADAVLTVSNYSSLAIRRCYGVHQSRLSVTFNGIDARRFHPSRKNDAVCDRYGLVAGNYILSVGRLEARKNLRALVQAYALLPDGKPPLVLVGQRDQSFLDASLDAQSRSGQSIMMLDSVPDDDLPAVYAGASLFAFPSLAEGFGMPLLEAMASGVPVVSSNATAMPEVVDDAALLFDPGDVGGMSDAMSAVLRDVRLRRRLIEAGHRRVKTFGWDTSANQLMSTIRSMVI